jgi:excisionase family DNA binding protein
MVPSDQNAATWYYPGVADEMTVTEAATALGVAEETIRKRIQRGDMQARRVGARVLLIPSEEVNRWREIGHAKPGPKPRGE